MKTLLTQQHTASYSYTYIGIRVLSVLLLSAIAFCFFIQIAEAAITYVGGASATGNSASYNIDLTSLSGGSDTSPSEGDIVVVMVASSRTSDGNPGVNTSGYTEIADLYANDTYDVNMSVNWKIMSASPDTTVNCNGSGSASFGSACIAHVWRGVDTSTPLDVTSTTATGVDAGAPNAPSITPVTSGAVVLALGGRADSSGDATVTAPTGYGNHVNNSVDPGNAAMSAVASKAWTSGAEDPAIWTDWTTTTSGSWAAVTMALRPELIPSLSGTVYTDEGSTTATSGLSVKIAVSTTTSPTIYSTTTSSGGAWEYILDNTTGMTAGTPVAVWVDGNPDLKANLVTRLGSGLTASGLDLYKGNVILRHEDSGPLTLANLDAHDDSDYSDMLFTASSSAGTLELEEGISLYVVSGDTFSGAATSTTYTGGVTNNGTITTHGATTTFAGSDGTIDGAGTNTFTSIVASSSSFLNDATTWTARSAAGDDDSWTSITYGDGMFVAVGAPLEEGLDMVMTSPDGINWTARSAAGNDDYWTSITYGNGLFVAVGWGFPDFFDAVMTSPDGINWTARSAAGNDDSWHSVTYGNGLFVAVGEASGFGGGTDSVMTSPDGINWTARSAAEANDWYAVAYGNGTFVAVGDNGTNRVMTSPDGINWTARSAAGNDDGWYGVTYGNDLFVAVGSSTSDHVMTSPDGINWTARSAAEAHQWFAVTYGNGLFVAVADNGTNRVMTSPDGITWTARSAAGNDDSWNSVTYGNGTFVAVGWEAGDRVMTSDSGSYATSFVNDGINWTARSAAGNNDTWLDVTYGEGLFVATGFVTADIVMTSPDGITWTVGTAPDTNLWSSITYGNGMFVAVGGDSEPGVSEAFMTSPDGITWTGYSALGDNDNWDDVTYGNGLFVAVGSSGDRVMTSPDGTTWTARSAAGDNDSWRSVTYGDGLFVAVSSGGDRVMTSPDGITWTARTAAGDDDNWQSVTYGNGLFVAVGSSGDRVMTSPDGITWTARTAAGDDDDWYSVTYGNGLFVAVSAGGDRVMTSPDGITWTARTAAGDDDIWQSVTYGNGLFVAVSAGGDRVMTSDSGSYYATSTLTFSSNASTTDLYIGNGMTMVAPSALTLFGDYTNNGTFTAGSGTVYEDTEATADGWHLEDAVFDNVTFGVTETAPWGMDISDDGLNLYVLGFNADNIRWYTMATPWDVENASYQGAFNVNSLDDWPNAVSISSDGTKAFFTGDTADGAAELTLSTPYDITTATYVDYLDISAKETSPSAMDFSSDGSKMYIAGEASNTIHQYNLGTAWDVSTGSFSQSFSMSSQDTLVEGIRFKPDGTAFYMIGASNDRVYEYSLGTAWDISTASYVQYASVSGQDFSPTDLEFDGDGVKMFVLGHDGDDISIYTIGTAGDAGSIDTDKVFSGNMTGESAFNDIQFLGNSTTTFSSNASTTDFTIGSTATVTAPTSLTIAGDFTNNGVFEHNSGTVYVSSSSAQTLSGTMTGSQPFNNLVFLDSGTKTFSDNASTTDLTIGAGTVVAPTSLTIAGDFTNNGVFEHNSGTVYVSSSSAQTLSGTMTGSQPFNNLVFLDSGTKTFSDNASTTDLTIGAGTVVAPTSLTIEDDYINNGIFTHNDGTVYFSGSVAQTLSGEMASTSAFNDVVFYGNSTKTYSDNASTSDFTIASGATVVAPSALTVTGDFTNNGVFEHNNGSISFMGTDVTLSGNLSGLSSFNDVYAIDTSTFVNDGITWTARSAAGDDDGFFAVTYGEGLFVAVGYAYPEFYSPVMTSPDGITWTARSAAGDDDVWRSVTYGNGMFVAVGNAGGIGGGTDRVMTSPDGITWTARSAAGDDDSWNSVTYGNGLFVAVGETGGIGGGTDRVMTSPDGITWTARSAAGDDDTWTSVTYGEGLFVAVGDDSGLGDDLVMTSPDGITWTVRSAAGDDDSWNSVTYGNGLFVVVGDRYAGDRVMTSPDGINWTARSAAGDDDVWWSVTYGNGLFVAIGEGDEDTGGDRVMTSPDGINWTARTATEASTWVSVVYGNEIFVALNYDGTNRIMTSDSGSYVTATSTLTFSSNASTTDLYIDESTTVVAPPALTLFGDYTNLGTVEWGTGTTTFSGTAAQTATGTMTGTSAFYNLEILNTSATTSFETALTVDGRLTATSSAIIEFPAGATTTVASFDVVGTDGSEITLRSTQTDTQWGLDATAHNVYYVDVKDSNACSGNGNITATNSTDSGNNDCWTIIAPEVVATSTISSAANQVFAIGQATTTISTITIIDAEETPTITAANDIRISIDTNKTDMLWDTSDTTAVFSGTASGKVANPVSYEDSGATLVVPVSTNFSASDTLTISGLSFSQFGSINVATSTLSISVAGASEAGGETWTAQSATGNNDSWRSVAYGGGLFVAVGCDDDSFCPGDDVVMTSPDGITWTARSAAGNDDSWASVTYGNGLFVAVGYGPDYVMTSPDGITWTARSASSSFWTSVTYGNELFVAVGYGGTNYVMTSPDGITWTVRSAAGDNDQWASVTYGNGLFVAVGCDASIGCSGDNVVMTSPDGITWTARSAAGDNDQWLSITYGNGLFVAIGRNGDRVMTSSDGITWTARSAAGDNDSWGGVTYGDGIFVAVGDGSDYVMTSSDGITWTARSAAGDNDSWEGVTYGDGMFVAVGDGSDHVMTSSGGSVTLAAHDDKTVTITGSLTVSDHDADQVENAFSYQNQTAAELYGFKLTPAGESSTIGTITFNLTGIRRIDSENLTNIALYRDINADGALDAGDVAVGGAGVLTISEQTGSIVFSTQFSATTSQNYILISDITNVKTNEYMTIALDVSGSVTGATTGESITPSGSVSSVQHIRGGGGGSNAEIGDPAPEGDGDVGGGGAGGGGGVGEEDDGESIGNEPGFAPPTASDGGFTEWTNGANALSSDSTYATAASTNLRQSYSVFGFNVPSGNTVQGIEVKLEASGSTAAGTIEVALSWNGDSSVTATKATSVLTGSDAVYTLGGPADTWGRSWTPSEFGDANFFVRVIGQPEGNTVRVDALQVQPYHQAGGGGGGGGGEI